MFIGISEVQEPRSRTIFASVAVTDGSNSRKLRKCAQSTRGPLCNCIPVHTARSTVLNAAIPHPLPHLCFSLLEPLAGPGESAMRPRADGTRPYRTVSIAGPDVPRPSGSIANLTRVRKWSTAWRDSPFSQAPFGTVMFLALSRVLTYHNISCVYARYSRGTNEDQK